jgi:UDP-N-acetylglucosamine 2-epimerase (non-hydrolysing)
MKRVFNVCGARPNFMKIAPLVHAMQRSSMLRSTVVHTGQHYSPTLSDVFFEELRIPRPEISLEVGSLPRLEQIALIEERFTPVVEQGAPALILVVGDVNSTVACARVGRKLGIPVAHVEAGLRSFDLGMPEEHNRIETDRLSDVLYVTEESGMTNLRNEQVRGRAILAGNVMIDTLIDNLPRATKSDMRSRLALQPKHYAVATFHRPSNVDTKESAAKVVGALRLVAEHFPVVLPIHPRTRESFDKFGFLKELAALHGLHLVEPMGYFDFIGLVRESRVVVTDSGGIQEETTYLGVPCLTMRENSERPSTISLGTNLLIGSDHAKLRAELENISAGRFKKGSVPPLWDGKSAERIVADIETFLR